MGEGNEDEKPRQKPMYELRRVDDSFHVEAGKLSSTKGAHNANVSASWSMTMQLAFQSIGVIYGDIGTSPLYVFSSTFTNGIKDKEDILGVLSLILYTIILIPMIKYVFIVLWANDNGDGGTFALYSKICRYADINLTPNQQQEDKKLSNYQLEVPSSRLGRSEKIKTKLESSSCAKIILFLCAILGTSMVIGDGILTPSISVLSAVDGIRDIHGESTVYISVGILVLLFCAQRFGTDKVGYTFAPAICLWFALIGGIGFYNWYKYDVTVLRAFDPKYIVDYFRRNGKQGWISLGGVVLCITGTEAMFADLGHFNVRAVQISFTGMVFPAISLAYIGQSAYLTKFPEKVGNAFYASVPSPMYWPTFVIAVLASIIASQAMISGTFAIISQSLSLGCFPRVKVVHTSAKYEGQVYIPEINYFLMVCCVIVTLAFKSTTHIGNAYGIAVVAVMLITTSMLTLIMLLIWKTSILLISLFFVILISVELVYFSSVLFKFVEGGYLPLCFSLALMTIMVIWHYTNRQRYLYELKHKVSNDYVKQLANDTRITRLPGIGLLYSELVQGIPPIFPHFVRNIPSVHSIIILISIKSIPISRVLPEERFLFRQVKPKEYRVFRCVVRYGYNDIIKEPHEFERQLMESLKSFIRHDNLMVYSERQNIEGHHPQPLVMRPYSTAVHVEEQVVGARISTSSIESFDDTTNKSLLIQIASNKQIEKEIEFVERAMEEGVFYLIGETEMAAHRDSNFLRRFVINTAYPFLRRNFRQADRTLAIPRDRLLRVGMTYEI